MGGSFGPPGIVVAEDDSVLIVVGGKDITSLFASAYISLPLANSNDV